MQVDAQLQSNKCACSNMDAKDFLDCLAKNPPEPFYGGCVKLALKHLLRNLQIGGVYHEHGGRGYQKLKMKVAKAESPVIAVDDVYQAPHIISTGFGPTVHTSRHTQNTPTDKLFTKTEKFIAACPNNNSSNHNRSSDIKRRNKSLNTFSQDVYFSETTLSDAMEDTRRYAENGKAVIHQNLEETSLEATGNFLSRMALSEKQSAKELIASLGYEVPQGKSGIGNNQKEDAAGHSKSSWLRSLWSDRTYAFILLVVLWAYSLRSIMFFFLDYEILLMTKLIPSLWSIMVTGTNTACFVSCVRTDHLYSFFFRWATLFQDPVTRALGMRGTLCTRYVKVAVIVVWMVVVTNIGCIIFIMIMDDKFSAGMNLVLYVTGQRSVPVIIGSSVILFYCGMGWIGVIVLIVVLCHHVCSHFEEFNQVFKLHIAAASNGFPQHMKLLRERHLAMCETVSVLDRFVRVVIGIFYSVTISLACLLLYHLVEVPMDTSVTCIAVMWLTSGVLFMAVVTYHMANVNVAMHSAADDLYTLQTSNLTVEQLAQLQLFLAKVNGPSMGFTVLGMVTITRELMLTLFGLYMTYGIVLLQF